MKDQDNQQDQTITSAGEVELTEEELDQVAGGFATEEIKREEYSKKLKGDFDIKRSSHISKEIISKK